MGIHVETLTINFSPRELQWLGEQAAKYDIEISEFIRNRTLRNFGAVYPDQEFYRNFGPQWHDMKKLETRHKHLQNE
jgi:hypothetical protein